VRLLALAALWVRIQMSLKNTKWVTYRKQRGSQHNLATTIDPVKIDTTIQDYIKLVITVFVIFYFSVMENIGLNVPNPFTLYEYFGNRIRPLSSTASVQSNQVLTGAVLQCRRQ
jgi:hypothetical protein